ncbi:GntR family transcriptional regulator [Roseomonas elaeocarpi]|uniref:GntR family transcriptional regulator n=1 Tax=Roseomonas elaeocarpi TaxID=907779 RepID=A0ABV6JVR1_9PROT
MSSQARPDPSAEADRGVDRPETEPLRGDTLPSRIAARLRDAITRDDLPEGTRLRERELAEQLQVSRTPFREALKLLAADGLVTLVPGRGAVVAGLSPAEVAEKLDVLGALERLAGQAAIRLATGEELDALAGLHARMVAAHAERDREGYFRNNQAIHGLIVRMARNRTLLEIHQRLNHQLYRTRYLGSVNEDVWAQAIREHEEILRLLRARDPALGAVLEQHVHSTWRRIAPVGAGGSPAG